jgi:hypothetical protein
VQSVEMRDVVIPDALQDAMSREAQARAREAGAHHPRPGRDGDRATRSRKRQSYQNNPTALHLRAMNMLYEG